MTPDPLPCPFCGSQEILKRTLPGEYFEINGVLDFEIYYWQQCLTCESNGPHMISEIESIEAWNAAPRN